jgi:hypothetical protein
MAEVRLGGQTVDGEVLPKTKEIPRTRWAPLSREILITRRAGPQFVLVLP